MCSCTLKLDVFGVVQNVTNEQDLGRAGELPLCPCKHLSSVLYRRRTLNLNSSTSVCGMKSRGDQFIGVLGGCCNLVKCM